MIKTIEFENFKAFKKVTIPLEPLTVFVGPNASGKTSILQGVEFLTRCGRENPDSVFSRVNAWARVHRSGARGPLRLRAVSSEGTIELVGTPGGHERPEIPESIPFRWEKTGKWRAGEPEAATVLRFNVERLAASSSIDHPPERLSADGTGLVPLLAHMHLSQHDTFVALENALRSVVPAIRSIRIEQDRARGGYQLFFDVLGGATVPSTHASSGTFLALGLLTYLLTRPAPPLILYDDLDQGLHPKAQLELIAVVRRIMAQNPKLQVLATTHSPYLLDHLKPEEIRLTVLDEKGEADCRPLAESPDFAKWKDEMTPGEMWSVLGEDWILKLRGQGVR